MTRCPDCPVPASVPCFAAGHRLTDWCADLPKWSRVVLGRSLGLIVDEPCPEAEALHERARECPHASRRYKGCACEDRVCRRDGRIVSGLDCLLCVANGDG